MDPNILFACPGEWIDLRKRNSFLKDLLGWLDIINRLENVNILWTTDLETEMWSNPAKHPWFYGDLANPLIVTIHTLFRQKTLFIDANPITSSLDKPFEIKCNDLINIANCAYQMLHSAIHLERQFTVCYAFDTLPNNCVAVCPCDNTSLILPCVNRADGIVMAMPLALPETISEFNQNIDVVLDHVRQTIFGGRKFFHTYEFTTNFIQGYLDSTRNQRHILKCVVKKLVMSPSEAAQDGGLQDKDYTNDRTGLRRLRVTQESRIDYRYDGLKVVFIEYFDEGSYDNSLR